VVALRHQIALDVRRPATAGDELAAPDPTVVDAAIDAAPLPTTPVEP
jgi:hypothetical protein